MKTKTFTLMSALVFSLVLLLSFASAAVDFIEVANNDSTVQQGNSVIISFKTQESGNGDLTDISFNTPITFTSGSNTFDSEASITNVITSLDDGTLSNEMTLTVNIPSSQTLGDYTSNLTLTGKYTNTVDYDLPLSITVIEKELQNFCDYSDNENLRINIEDIEVEGFGDDNEWFAFDKIRVEVEVENDGDEDINDVVLEWGLYDENSADWIIDDEENDFNIKDGDDETIIIEFTLDDPDEFDEDGDYTFYVWATGEDEEFDDDKTCVSDSDSISIEFENDFVILAEIEVNGESLDELSLENPVQCGAQLTVVTEVWNIGEDDQDDVVVELHNKELDIYKTFEMGDIDSLDKETLEFSLEIPSDAEEKWYNLELTIYDEDGDVYENDFDDDESIFNLLVKVEGACKIEASASLTAQLESEALAGKEMAIKITVSNTGSDLMTYDISASGYQSWASDLSLDKNILALAAGESQEVTLTLIPNKDASGSQSFSVDIYSDDELVKTQALTVSVEESGFRLSSLTESFGDNWYLWAVGILNIILIIAIIIIAIKASKK